MDCRICGRETLPSCYISGTNKILEDHLQTCMLFEFLQLDRHYRVCLECCQMVERCARGIYYMRQICHIAYRSWSPGLCFLCDGLKVHRQLDITEGDIEYLILYRLVGEFDDGDIDVCDRCYVLVADLAVLYNRVFSANPEFVEKLSPVNQHPRRKCSSPVDIPGQRPHFRASQATSSTDINQTTSVMSDDSWCIFQLDIDLDADGQQAANIQAAGPSCSYQQLNPVPEPFMDGSPKGSKNIRESLNDFHSGNPDNSTLENQCKDVSEQKKEENSKVKDEDQQAAVPSRSIGL